MQIIIKQAVKFVLVGALNTLIDLGVLNILIFVSGVTTGFGYSALKSVSFIAAVINSYFLNKFWTFKAQKTKVVKKEFAQFFTVSLIGFGINVGVASFVVNIISVQFGLAPKIWANIGAVTATLVGMTWNFFGYKFMVFKDKNAKFSSLS